MDKRAKLAIQDLIPVGLVMVVAGIILAFGAQVTGDVSEDFTANSYEANISDNALEGLDNLSNRMPTIGLVAAIVIVIGLLVSGFGYLMGRR